MHDLNFPLKPSFNAVSIESSGGPFGNTLGAFHCQRTKVSCVACSLCSLVTGGSELSTRCLRALAHAALVQRAFTLPHTFPPAYSYSAFQSQLKYYFFREAFFSPALRMLSLHLAYPFQSINLIRKLCLYLCAGLCCLFTSTDCKLYEVKNDGCFVHHCIPGTYSNTSPTVNAQ